MSHEYQKMNQEKKHAVKVILFKVLCDQNNTSNNFVLAKVGNVYIDSPFISPHIVISLALGSS